MITAATHLGDGPGNVPNAVFGWGLLNLGSVIDGPMRGCLSAWSSSSDRIEQGGQAFDALEKGRIVHVVWRGAVRGSCAAHPLIARSAAKSLCDLKFRQAELAIRKRARDNTVLLRRVSSMGRRSPGIACCPRAVGQVPPTAQPVVLRVFQTLNATKNCICHRDRSTLARTFG
jgi:hypothetical protein